MIVDWVNWILHFSSYILFHSFLFLDGLCKLFLPVDINSQARSQEYTEYLEDQQANANTQSDVQVAIDHLTNSINATFRVDARHEARLEEETTV